MRRLIILLYLFGVFFFTPSVSAITSNILESYSPSETIIGQLSENVLSPIAREQVGLVREGHIQVGFDYDVREIEGKHFFWLIAPQNPGNYTLIMRDVVSVEQGYPQIADFEQDFFVSGNKTDYSINPGFIVTNENFEIRFTLYESYSKTITVDFPSSREITLAPGVNYVDFPVQDFVGNNFVNLNLGKYKVPAMIIGIDHVCGDGEIDGSEVCDGSNLNGESCSSVPGDYVSGNLFCSNNCLTFNTANCEETSVCDEDHLILCVNQTSCVTNQGHWYNSSCNEYEQGSVCDEDHLGICTNEETCLDSRGYWYDEHCYGNAKDECGRDKSEFCLTFEDCKDFGGYWYDDKCHEGDYIYNVPSKFDFNPKIIRSTVLSNEKPSNYFFEIVNTGEYPINNLKLNYNKEIFLIEPNENINIEANGSVEFNLSVKNASLKNIREVIYAEAGDVGRYLLFSLAFTKNQDEVGTNYLKNLSGEARYYCSEIPGSFGSACSEDETCEGDVVSSIGLTSCCVGECKSKPSESKAWIGYLIAAILILVLLIIYTKYKKTGNNKNPMAQKMVELEKKLP